MKRYALTTMVLVLLAVLTASSKSERTVLASWYETKGTRVHRNYPTAAMNNVPLFSKIKVTNPKNGKSCIVTITDRMHRRLVNNIDLSRMAFGLIENHKRGVCYVKINNVTNDSITTNEQK